MKQDGKGTRKSRGVVGPLRRIRKPLLPEDLAAASGIGTFSDFIYRCGPIINTPQVYALFVGDWTSTANQTRATRLGQFIADMLNGPYMNILSQYGCGTSGALAGSAFVSKPDSNLSGADIRGIIQNAINGGTVPEASPSNAYVVFLDDATSVNDTQDGIEMCEATSDNAFGFHDFFTTTAGHHCYFAVVPGLTNTCLTSSCPGNDAGCSLHLGQTQEQRQTQVASHELSEMFSDPEVGSNEGWSSLAGPHENGDICNGNSGTLTVGPNSWNVQLMYSKWHDMNSGGATTCIAGSPDPLPSLLPACTIVTDRSTFGKDEIDALLTLGPANISAAFYVIADGFTPSDLGITAASLVGTPNVAPTVTLTPAVTGMSVSATALVANDPSLGGGIDRFTWVYQVSFTGTGGFPAAVGGVTNVTINASLTRMNAPVCGASSSAVVQLVHEPNPYEIDGPISWLSTDLRVFQINAGASKFNVAMGTDPNAFIQQVITNLNTGNTGGQTFENDISLDENTSRLELAETVGGTAVFNFAVAKVRYRALSSDAAGVRVFFRLFPASTTSTAYDQATSYRRGGLAGVTIPKLGIHGTEATTIPCFALPRIDTTTQSMDAQTDTPNVQTIVHDASGQEVHSYFGCWLDINQPSQLRFPLNPSPVDGPYTSGGLQSVQSLIRNAHQCLVAEVAFDPDPIPVGATPGSSDKLAQRNLSIVDSDNPGSPASHTIPNTFEMRPSTPPRLPGDVPDELLIDWRTLPDGSEATLFIPGAAAAIVELANRLYVSHHLTQTDADTLKCPARGLTYLPIPAGTGPNIAGLMTVTLPSTVRKGQAFKVVVRQISDVVRIGFNKDVKAAAEDFRRWRRVLGSFQISIPVRTADVLLEGEKRLLATLQTIQRTIPQENRWSRVFQNYVAQVAARVTALGERGVIVIVPPSKRLPDASVGTAYHQTFTAKGGVPPYHFSVVVAAGLPPGLRISSAGALSGTPTKAGRFNFSITAVDAEEASAQPQVYTIFVG